jgi:DNA-binding FadR family transcriptional regulator
MSTSAEQIKSHLASELSLGALAAGQKLPTERELASRFNVSRTVVRDALILLEADRLIIRQVGRGTFVADALASAGAADAPPELPAGMSPAALLEARSVIEGELAALAVLNATEADVEMISSCCGALPAAKTSTEFERLDSAFHRAIAVATHNPLLLAAYGLIASARDNPEWRKLKRQRHQANPRRRAQVQNEHQRVVDAIRNRDAAAARRHMLAHLNDVRINLLGR